MNMAIFKQSFIYMADGSAGIKGCPALHWVLLGPCVWVWATHWSMGNLPVVTPLKKIAFSLQQLTLSSIHDKTSKEGSSLVQIVIHAVCSWFQWQCYTQDSLAILIPALWVLQSFHPLFMMGYFSVGKGDLERTWWCLNSPNAYRWLMNYILIFLLEPWKTCL